MLDMKCIGICTGGGDAPGLNAVIRATVKAAILKYKGKVIGIPDGRLALASATDTTIPTVCFSRYYQSPCWTRLFAGS